MLGTGTTRPHPDAPDQADDLVGYLRRGPRELPPGIRRRPGHGAGQADRPGARVRRRARRPAGRMPDRQADPNALGQPFVVAEPAVPRRHGRAAEPAPEQYPAERASEHQADPARDEHAPPTRPAPSGAAPSGSLFTLPATSGQLSVEVSSRVFAARTLHIRVVVSTPQAHTLRADADRPDLGRAGRDADRKRPRHRRPLQRRARPAHPSSSCPAASSTSRRPRT